jgi:hypothetical protein
MKKIETTQKRKPILRPLPLFRMTALSALHTSSLNKYIVHAYHSPIFPDLLVWNVVGRLVEAVALPPADLHPSSIYLTAADLGIKESVLKDMRAWTLHFVFHNGREDPRAEQHSSSYLEAKHRVEELSGVIDPAVKKYFAEHKIA